MTPSLFRSTGTELATVQHPASDLVLQGDVLSPALLIPGQKSPHEAVTEYFAARISNDNTRKSYRRDVEAFCAWCFDRGLTLHTITPVDVAAYRDQLVSSGKEPTTIKRHLSALRALFAYLVANGAMKSNPAREVKSETVRRGEGKTPALDPQQMRQLFESFDPSKLVDLRDRALIGVMAYTFARVTAACRLTRADYIDLGRSTFLRLKEKGGVQREVPCHPVCAEYLDAWIAAAGIAGNGALFPTFGDQAHTTLSGEAIDRYRAHEMVKRRLIRAKLPSLFTSHSFRATGITTFLENGGHLETAQTIAGHADSRTTKGYDRRATRMELAEILRVAY